MDDRPRAASEKGPETESPDAPRVMHAMEDYLKAIYRLEARIASALGHPTRDPHGDPIPSADEHLFGRPLTARINVAPRPRGARGRR